MYFYLFSFPPRFLTANLFTNCKVKLQWMYFLHFYLFIIFYFKYIHVPTINQVFSFILWLDHHSVSFLLLAPIMGLSWSFGPRQLKTILLLLGVKNHTFNPGVLLLQLLLLWLLPPHILVPVLLHYSNQCSGFVSISFLNLIPQGAGSCVWFHLHHLVTFTASLS